MTEYKDGSIMTTQPDGTVTMVDANGNPIDPTTTTTTTTNFDVEAFCRIDYPDWCVSGKPDIDAICDNKYSFPPGTFDGSNILSFCEIDMGDTCTLMPEVCTSDGKLLPDLCGAFPEMCDMSAATYDPCAADLMSCLSDANFDLCTSFPSLCGLTTSDFQVPLFLSLIHI